MEDTGNCGKVLVHGDLSKNLDSALLLLNEADLPIST